MSDFEEHVIEDFEDPIPEPEPTPMAEENRQILDNCNITDYEKAYHKIFLEVIDISKGFHFSKESFTSALLNGGSHENPQELYEYMDLLISRLEKMHVVKRLCGMLGLHSEMEEILTNEMNLIYNRPSKPKKSFVVDNGVIAGDVRRN